VTAIFRARLAYWIAAAVVPAAAAPAAEVCGARVSVRQIAMSQNEDGTRNVRYRASVETDQTSCARVSFTIVRSYLKPDGSNYEDMIPVEVQVPGRAVDVEGDTVADTRRLIYWRAEKVSCQPCAKSTGDRPMAPAPSYSTTSVPGTVDGGGGSRMGGKAAIVGGGAALVAGGAAVVLLGGGSGETADAPGTGSNPTPRPTPRPTAGSTPAPTSAPTATPVPTPVVFPGAPPAATGNTESGEITFVSSDPPAGTPISATRSSIGLRINLYIDRVGTDMRLEVQMWSGGEMCVRDTSAPLEIKARTPYAVTYPMSNTRRCNAPFRTTLTRIYLNDRGTPKLVQDFPVGFDFVP
jgi:hypothetical protein